MSQRCVCGLSVWLLQPVSRVRHGRRRDRVDERQRTVGRTLVVYICLFMVLSGIVLFVADRLGFGGERGKSIVGALGESLPPLVALIAALLAS